MNYKQQRQDPRWQKKRLLIMERDSFTCRDCGETFQTLNVHHCIYIPGRMVWDYPDELLLTLCEEPCHRIRQGREQALHIAIAEFLAHVPVEYIEKRAWELLANIYPDRRAA